MWHSSPLTFLLKSFEKYQPHPLVGSIFSFLMSGPARTTAVLFTRGTPSQGAGGLGVALKSTGIGGAAGMLGSLVGMGGGFVAIPFLTGWLGLTQVPI